MTGVIIIIIAILLIAYFTFKHFRTEIEVDYEQAERNISEALIKFQKEDFIEQETTPTVKEVETPIITLKKKITKK